MNMLFDRAYAFRSNEESYIEVKDNPTEYLEFQEESQISLTTKRFYAEHPKFFQVLAKSNRRNECVFKKAKPLCYLRNKN